MVDGWTRGVVRISKRKQIKGQKSILPCALTESARSFVPSAGMRSVVNNEEGEESVLDYYFTGRSGGGIVLYSVFILGGRGNKKGLGWK